MRDNGDDDIDLMLSRYDNIVPSSGFTASVMDAITREVTAPPPIPFPWKRALPGLGWCMAVTIASIAMSPVSGGNPPPARAALDMSTALIGAGWIASALVVTLASVALSIRRGRRRN
jgi:hypothetical protein